MILFASDFDGTMHFHDARGWGYIPRKNIEAVRSFRTSGNLFGFDTGRPLEGILRDLDDDFKRDFMITSTGSVITYGMQPYKIINMAPVDEKAISSLLKIYSDRFDFVFHAIKKVYTVRQFSDAYHEQNLISEEELLHHKITGISVYVGDIDRAAALVQEMNRNYESISVYQNLDWLDIVAKGVSKGSALRTAKEIFHADKTAAIGDAGNDISMLDAADISFTFHSSEPAVQSHADYLVDSVAEAVDILMDHEKDTGRNTK